MTQESQLKNTIRIESKPSRYYIGELKTKYPLLYNIWRAFRFTVKGKKAGYSDTWNNFSTFVSDVLPSYIEGYRFRRKDTSLPYSKDNFMWVSPKHIGVIKQRSFLTYNNETHLISEWAKILGLNYNGIRQRYFYRIKKDYTPEEILYGRLKKSRGKVTSINTISDEQKQRDKISKMFSAYKCKDRKRGYETTITKGYLENIIRTGKCIYCGDRENLGLDRIDNNRGHEIGNVVPCCYECNVARGNNFSFEEMFTIGKAIKEIKKKRHEANIKQDC